MPKVRWLAKSDEDLKLANTLKIEITEQLSSEDFTLVKEPKDDSSFENKDFLKLIPPTQYKWKPIFVDFEDALFTKQTIKRGKKDILARAIAGTKTEKLNVFDTTMGFGMDGFFLSLLGHKVVSCEKLNWLYALVLDAFARYKSGPMALGQSEWSIEFGNSLDETVFNKIKAILDQRVDVLLCDPLFDPKRGASPKEMQLLHALSHEDDTDESGIEFADKIFGLGSSKVVVKRPIHGKPLKSKVSYDLKGRTIRYDVYRF